jgi:hypothetical protein
LAVYSFHSCSSGLTIVHAHSVSVAILHLKGKKIERSGFLCVVVLWLLGWIYDLHNNKSTKKKKQYQKKKKI